METGRIATTYQALRGARESGPPAPPAIEPGHEAWVRGEEPAVLIEVDFEGDTIARFGLPSSHRHA